MIVISLGGSIIVPDKVDYDFLNSFKKVISKYTKKNKFVIVTGGGSTCRKYLKALEKKKFHVKIYSLIGIATTKLNARVVAGFFKKTHEIPDTLKDVKKVLKKNNIAICGALGYKPDMTTDGNAAEVAKYLKADLFVNLTNVKGLYNKDPSKYKNAKLIKKISYQDFYDIARKIKFKAGQHFVLDKVSAKIIKDSKIKTVILNGRNLKNFENCLKGKSFVGTTIF
ncbi:UMP kinase [archaeon]|nr:UMP kinase [archaeon]